MMDETAFLKKYAPLLSAGLFQIIDTHYAKWMLDAFVLAL